MKFVNGFKKFIYIEYWYYLIILIYEEIMHICTEIGNKVCVNNQGYQMRDKTDCSNSKSWDTFLAFELYFSHTLEKSVTKSNFNKHWHHRFDKAITRKRNSLYLIFIRRFLVAAIEFIIRISMTQTWKNMLVWKITWIFFLKKKHFFY